MRKFIVYTRALPGCKTDSEAPTVVEVEGELVTAMEDPSIMWLPVGEFKFRITKPEFLNETHEVKQADGSRKKVQVPSVYYSHSCYATSVAARVVAVRMIQESLDFEVRKGRLTSYSNEELKAKYAEIQEVML